MDRIISTERDVHRKRVHKVPEITKPCGLHFQVAKILVAPIQRAALQSYLHQKVVKRHGQAIAVSLPMEFPFA